MVLITQILVGSAMFILPGYALLAIVNPRLDADPAERFSLGVGLSLAVIPLSLYLSTLIGVRQGPAYVAIFLAVAGVVTAGDLYGRWRVTGFSSLRSHWATILAFAVIALAALIARILGVSGLNFPLWTDSYHHTVIAQIIADSGLVPSSYEPYAHIEAFSYHFGFHTMAAWFHWLTGLPVPRSVVVVGQVINALVVPTTYVLAKRLWKNSFIGLSAGLLLATLSHMPAYFVNWGRYPQLSGQMLFPIVIALFLAAIDDKVLRVRKVCLAAIAIAGLFLVHNRVTLFALVFCGVAYVQVIVIRRTSRRALWQATLTSALAFGLAALIDLHWILNFAHVYGTRVLGMVEAGYSQSDFGSYFDWSFQYFTADGAPPFLWAMAGLGLVAGAVRRDRGVLLVSLGTSALLLLSMSYLIGITGLFTVLVVAIWIYLPVGLLAGYFLGQVARWASPRLRRAQETSLPRYKSAALLLTITICAASAPMISGLTAPENGFVRPADLRAMQWISEHVPDDALFYISTHFWTPHLAHGLDAGYWIPYFTLRQTILPPEPYSSDGTVSQMNAINQRASLLLQKKSIGDLYHELLEYKVTHVYIGERKSNLDASVFLGYPEGFELLYDRSGVWIFKVKPDVQSPDS